MPAAESRDFWLHKIANLKVDMAHANPAPHKPLLLLVILDLAEAGQLTTTPLPLSPELAFMFSNYWSIVAHRRSQKPDVTLPYHHLGSDGFWIPLDDQGHPSPNRRQTRYAALNSGFTEFLKDPENRSAARRIIVTRYFQPPERIALSEMLQLPKDKSAEMDLEAAPCIVRAARTTGREVRFRVRVVAAYNYTCALTGYRLTTISSGCIVDAAHIRSFADSRNNEPQNGVALCKNAHWLFDQGLWTISNDYRCIVAVGKFSECAPDARPLKDYHGDLLRLPPDKSLWPNPLHLAWHRKHVFQGY